jgi:hypothetical protein
MASRAATTRSLLFILLYGAVAAAGTLFLFQRRDV